MKPLPAIAMALAMTASLGTAAVSPACAQVPPSRSDIAGHGGLHQAAHTGDVAVVLELVAAGTDLEARDRAGRTALHLAAFASQDEVVRTLAAAGADMNALENGLYDIVTIAPSPTITSWSIWLCRSMPAPGISPAVTRAPPSSPPPISVTSTWSGA